MPATITQREYQALADVRYRIRAFLAFSEGAARSAGIEPQQHQLLLAVRGLPGGTEPTIKVIAERLQLRHHSAVGLVSRAVGAGLIERRPGAHDGREITLHLTRRGSTVLDRLSHAHRAELRAAATHLVRALRTLAGTHRGR